jgi:hypothetical protein
LRRDLESNEIPIAVLTGARLPVELSFSVVPWNERTGEIFLSDGKVARTPQMNRCIMKCESNVTTDEVVYRSTLIETQESPIGWPVSTVPSPD